MDAPATTTTTLPGVLQHIDVWTAWLKGFTGIIIGILIALSGWWYSTRERAAKLRSDWMQQEMAANKQETDAKRQARLDFREEVDYLLNEVKTSLADVRGQLIEANRKYEQAMTKWEECEAHREADATAKARQDERLNEQNAQIAILTAEVRRLRGRYEATAGVNPVTP